MQPAERRGGSGAAANSAARRVLSWARGTLAVVVVAAALALVLVRFGLPLVKTQKDEVEQWVSGLLDRPVTIGALRAYWQGWTAQLEIEGVGLHPRGDPGSEAAITFERVRIGVDPVESIRAGRVVAGSLVIVGATLTVKRLEDGRLIVAGMRAAGGPALERAGSGLARWILKDGSLSFESATVKWLDARRGGEPIVLTRARIDLVNDGPRHRLSGQFSLPGISTRGIRFTLDADGDLLTSDWSGRMTLSAEGIRAEGLERLSPPVGQWVSSGSADLDVWTGWKQGAMERARLLIRADGVTLGEAAGELRLHGGSAEIDASRVEQGWSADVVLVNVHTSQGRWRTSRGTLNYLAGGGGPRLVGRFGYARLGDLKSLFKRKLDQLGVASGYLQAYRPSADLRDLHFSVALDNRRENAFELSADFDRLSASMGEKFPALSEYEGRIELDDGAGVVSLSGGLLDVSAGDLFESRFKVRTRGGRIAWKTGPGGLRADVYDLDLSADALSARLSGFVHWDGDEAGPLTNLVAEFSSNDVGAARQYIPDPLLKEKLARWLRLALEGGTVSGGRLLFHGRAGAFPFDEGEGVFNARFDVAGGRLNYAPGWPRLFDLAGEVRFRGRRMEAVVSGGGIFDSRIESATVSMEGLGLGVPVLEVRGEAEGPAADGLRYLEQSPKLRPRFERQLDDLSADGNVRLKLALDLPLDKSGIRLDGSVSLHDNRIHFARLQNGLTGVNGTLHFDRRGAQATDLAADYLGRPVAIGVSSAQSAPHDTRVRISGRADRVFLARHLANAGLIPPPAAASPAWLEPISGETAWAARIDFPGPAPGSERHRRVTLESSLQGLGIDLPFPLGKPAAGIRPLELSMRKADAARNHARLSMGDLIRAFLEIREHKDGLRLSRGSIRLGGGEAALPVEEGLRITGSLERLDAGPWLGALERGTAPDAKAAPDFGLREVSLEVAALNLLGARFGQTGVHARRDAGGAWTARLDGAGVEGSVRIPPAAAGGAIEADFERLDYTPAPGEGGAGEVTKRAVDPRVIPPLRFSSARFSYDGRELGRIRFEASPTNGGLGFDNISIESPAYELTANGTWKQDRDGDRSDFSVSIRSESFGALLQSLGFGGTNVRGGTTDIFLDANWRASPMEFDLGLLNGSLHFRSLDGRLLGVRRGATGRIFGLLSFPALPRRLMLDFTDLFEKGVSYTRMEGSFNIESGQAYTNNLMMDTDTALVEIAGRTGLVTEDYDQVMTVTPKLTSSIPFAPIWLAEKVFRREGFDRVFAAQYNITGPWTDPEVEPIETVEPRPADRG